MKVYLLIIRWRNLVRIIKKLRTILVVSNKMAKIIIDTTKKSSEKDIDDLRELLELLSERYHFRWHLDTYN